MSQWIRFDHNGSVKFGTLIDDIITVHSGSLFEGPSPTSETVAVTDVTYLPPCEPTKMLGLVNNFHAAAEKQGLPIPEEPLYFIKPPSCYAPHNGIIAQPRSYEGRVVYEGEIGIVIAKKCRDVSDEQVADCIFGYTCVNDVTALQLINADESYAQWTRAKSFDTFGAFGPTINDNIDPMGLQIQTLLNGRVRQDYPVSDMIFSPHELVKRLSRDMTLMPGDVITCGTSVGVLPMKPGSTIEVHIEGIGTLENTYEAAAAE